MGQWCSCKRLTAMVQLQATDNTIDGRLAAAMPECDFVLLDVKPECVRLGITKEMRCKVDQTAGV